MAAGTAKIFMHGRSQAVRLQKEFRLPGKEVRETREGKRFILEQIEETFDADAWFVELDRFQALYSELLPEGRPEQAPMPDDDIDWQALHDESAEPKA